MIPENNETFPVVLVDRSNVPYHTVNTLHITVQFNDDPFGLIGFKEVDKVAMAEEPKSANDVTVLTFDLTRRGGLIGAQSVFWKV